MTTATAERFTTGNDDDDDWADAPVTPEEKAQIAEGREEFARGEYLTLKEFKEGL